MKLFILGTNKKKDKRENLKKGEEGDPGITEHVVQIRDKKVTIIPEDEEDPKKIVIRVAGSDPGKEDTVLELLLDDDDEPLTEEQKKLCYKSSKHVMAGRRIRELMNAHKKATMKVKMGKGSASDLKTKFIVGMALTLQVIAVILIFI